MYFFTLGSCRAKVIKVSKCWDLKTSLLLRSDNFHIKHSQLKSKKIILLLILLCTLQALGISTQALAFLLQLCLEVPLQISVV